MIPPETPPNDFPHPSKEQLRSIAPHHEANRRAALRELGWRLQHHCAARDVKPDALAEQVGLQPDDFALALVGLYDLPFSTLSAILDLLDLEWEHLYGTEFPHRRAVHELTLDSDAWHAIESGTQPFDIRRDVERYRAGDWLHLYEKVDTAWTGRVLTMEITYLLYLASVGLPPGYVAMALRPVETSRLTTEASPLTEAQRAELRARLDAYARNPHDRRSWDDVEEMIAHRPSTDPPE